MFPKSSKPILFMNNLPLVVAGSFFAFILCLGILFAGCRKDIPVTADEPFLAGDTQENGQTLPITLEEAKTYFENLKLQTPTSLNTDGAYAFVQILPVWDSAFISLSDSGREIAIVPLADSSIRVLNNGRADAKLLFTKFSSDSIDVQIILYAADSLYYASHNNTLIFNDFTGSYAFFDISYNFQYGVIVEAGIPVANVDSITFGSSQTVSYRQEACLDVDIFVFCEEQPQVFTNGVEENCVVSVWIWTTCPQGGGGGGGGGGGSGGGGGGGGGYGTGGNGSANFWSIFYNNVPLDVFLANGGTLPPGLDFNRAQHLIAINQVYHLSQANLQWLANNALILDAIYAYQISHPAPTGDNLNAIARLISLTTQYNLNFFQQYYLASHLDLVGDIYKLLAAYPNDPAALEIVNFVIRFNLDFITLDELNYLYDNLDGIEEASTPPTNPPIDVAHPICAEILTFATYENEVTQEDYAAIVLTNAYYQFNVPGGSSFILEVKQMRIEIQANFNTACLASSNVFAANAINTAVLQVQQFINNLPPGPISGDNKNDAKLQLLRRLYKELENQVQSCNSAYSSNVSFSSTNWETDIPRVNCDNEIVNCQ